MTEFKILNLDRDTADGFVNTVHWTASQSDGEFTASTYGTVGFTKTDGMNLLPFESLTEAQIVQWVKTSMGEEILKAIDANLAANIADQKTPKVASGLPWAVKA